MDIFQQDLQNLQNHLQEHILTMNKSEHVKLDILSSKLHVFKINIFSLSQISFIFRKEP